MPSVVLLSVQTPVEIEATGELNHEHDGLLSESVLKINLSTTRRLARGRPCCRFNAAVKYFTWVNHTTHVEAHGGYRTHCVHDVGTKINSFLEECEENIY